MSGDDTRHPGLTGSTSGSPGELEVTEVPDEVLEELGVLFGTRGPAEPSEADTARLVERFEDDDTADIVPVAFPADDTPNAGTRVGVTGTLTIPMGDPLMEDPGSTGGIVVIGDEDTAGIVIDSDELDRVVIVDVDEPDPNVIRRERSRRRKERSDRVRLLVYVGSAALFLFVALTILASPMFAVRSVTWEGVVYTSNETVSEVTDMIEGESVFNVDLAAARAAVLADPWVAEVRISKRYDGRAFVEVKERVPVVWWVGTDQKARIVDRNGTVIAVLDGRPTEYVEVTGVGPALDPGARADEVYRAAAQLYLALPPELSPLVASFAAGPTGELSMNLQKGTVIRFGPPIDLQEKLVSVVILLRRQNVSGIAVIDVSTGEATVQGK
jgi:cell division protein FtsQ